MEKVLELYDQHIWGCANPSASKDQVGAIATLLRLELRGVDVGQRWNALAPHLYPRLHEHALAFQDLHYIYALARAGYTEWVNECLHSLMLHADRVPAESQYVWLHMTIPIARGLIAYAQADWSTAIAELRPRLPKLHVIGGSHTQRRLFEQIYRQAVLQNEQSKKRDSHWQHLKAG